jgi:hypothetical protein
MHIADSERLREEVYRFFTGMSSLASKPFNEEAGSEKKAGGCPPAFSLVCV